MSDLSAPLAPLPLGAALLVVERREAAVRDTAPHGHAEGQLLGAMEGLLSVSVARNRFTIPATHAVWLPPRCVHAARSAGAFAGWSVYVAETRCAGLPVQPRVVRVEPLLRAAVVRAAGWGAPPDGPVQKRLGAVILDEIAGAPEEPLALAMPNDPRTLRVAEALLDDPGDRRGPAALAKAAGLSTRTLQRRFLEETGLPLTSWRRRARALWAVERLAGGEAVTTIALDLGYEDVGAFIAMFRRTIGVTPGRYAGRG